MRYRTPDDRDLRRTTRYDFDGDRLDRPEPIARDEDGRYAESRFSENRYGRFADERYADEERGAPQASRYASRYDYDAERERAARSPGAGGYGLFGSGREAGPAGGSGLGWPRGYGGRTGRGPKGYTRPDERILEDVCDRIGIELDASDVEVSVDKGEVRLIGTVGDRQTKFEMEEIADRVFGVKQVHNQIMVRRAYPADERVPSDLLPRKRSGPER